MALGHPFTDIAINYCGSVDFGGFTCCRSITEPSLSGIKGIHFNFIVKLAEITSEGEVVAFDLAPVFVEHNGNINDEAAEKALF